MFKKGMIFQEEVKKIVNHHRNTHRVWRYTKHCTEQQTRTAIKIGELSVPEGWSDPALLVAPVQIKIIKDEVLITVSCPIFPSTCILIAKYLFTGSLKNRSIDNLETQKKYISMKNSQFFNYLLYAKSK